MLYGIGCDLCSLSHLEKSLSSAHAAAFVRRVYGAAEQAARPVDDGLQSGVAGVQRIEGQARGAAGFRAAGRAGGRHFVEDAAGNGQRRQLAAS